MSAVLPTLNQMVIRHTGRAGTGYPKSFKIIFKIRFRQNYRHFLPVYRVKCMILVTINALSSFQVKASLDQFLGRS